MAGENDFRSPNQADEPEELLCTVPGQGQTPRRAHFVLTSQGRKAVIRVMSVELVTAPLNPLPRSSREGYHKFIVKMIAS